MTSTKLIPAPLIGRSIYALPPSIRQNLLRPSHFQQLSLRHASTTHSPVQTIRPLIPPPTENSGPLLSRLPNRALPTLTKNRTWLKTLPLFIALITLSSLAIFNYQKSSSSTVNSILYALRTNPTARSILGDEIYFAAKVPWIRGTMNQVHGMIDITFWVKGTRGMAQTKFISVRKRRDGFFETLEWSLTTEDGKIVQLLDLEEGDGVDVLRKRGS